MEGRPSSGENICALAGYKPPSNPKPQEFVGFRLGGPPPSNRVWGLGFRVKG